LWTHETQQQTKSVSTTQIHHVLVDTNPKLIH
jgi:hypothetical protein